MEPDLREATLSQKSFIKKLIIMVTDNGGVPPLDLDDVDSDFITMSDASAYIEDMKDELGLE